MKSSVCHFLCLVPFFAMIGCGGSAEVKPPAKAPEMTAEEKKNMDDQMEKMRKEYKKQ